jgi:hypothetical protein
VNIDSTSSYSSGAQVEVALEEEMVGPRRCEPAVTFTPSSLV